MRKRRTAVLGVLLGASLSVTLMLLVLEGRWREAIPLHLCSLSALAAAALAFSPRQRLLDFLWYLGMPGAALALVFPAPAVSRWQALLDASYVVTHALILVIPAACMGRGMRPQRGRTPVMMGTLLIIAAAAGAVNRRLGTDFLFLAAPPAGTPLQAVFAAGMPVYLMFLFAMMLALCLLMDALAGRIGRKPKVTRIFSNYTNPNKCAIISNGNPAYERGAACPAHCHLARRSQRGKSKGDGFQKKE